MALFCQYSKCGAAIDPIRVAVIGRKRVKTCSADCSKQYARERNNDASLRSDRQGGRRRR